MPVGEKSDIEAFGNLNVFQDGLLFGWGELGNSWFDVARIFQGIIHIRFGFFGLRKNREELERALRSGQADLPEGRPLGSFLPESGDAEELDVLRFKLILGIGLPGVLGPIVSKRPFLAVDRGLDRVMIPLITHLPENLGGGNGEGFGKL